MALRQLHLGAFMRPVGIHTAWWRYPDAYSDANFNSQHLKRNAGRYGGVSQKPGWRPSYGDAPLNWRRTYSR